MDKVKLKVGDSRGQVEAFEKIPQWVCANLVQYGNCNVHEETFCDFGGDEALRRWGVKPKYKKVGRNIIITIEGK